MDKLIPSVDSNFSDTMLCCTNFHCTEIEHYFTISSEKNCTCKNASFLTVLQSWQLHNNTRLLTVISTCSVQ